MRFIKGLFGFYIILINFNSYSQELIPVFENITDGLPSSEVHDMFQDSVGYMWFATDRGICKYNGDQFQQIEIEKYLKTKVVFKFFKEKENKIWIVSGKNRLYWFNPFEVNPKFINFLYNTEIQEIFSKSIYNRNISNIQFEKNGFVILFKNAPGFISVKYKSGCNLVNGQNEQIFLSKFTTTSFQLKQEARFHYVSFLNLNESKKKKRYIKLNSKKIDIDNKVNLEISSYFGVSCELKNKYTSIIAISDIIIQENKKQLISKKLKSKIISLLQSKNGLLVGTYNGVYELNANLEITNFFLSEYAITKIFLDENNNLWFSTLQSGIFLFRQNQIQQLKLKSTFNPKKLINVKNNLILNDDINNSCILINKDEKIIGQFNDFYIHQNTFRFTNKQIISILNLDPQIKNLKKTFYSYAFNENSNFYAKNGQIWVSKNGLNDYLINQNEHNLYVNFCFKISPNSLFISSEEGCQLLNINSKIPLLKNIKNSENKTINTFATLNSQYILGGTNGFYLFIKNELIKIHLKKDDNIIGIFKKDEKNAWGYSQNRIYHISLMNQIPVIAEFPLIIGKKNTVILSVVEFNNKLWVLTKAGLFVSEIKNLYPKLTQKKLKFIVDSIEIGGGKISSFEHQSLYAEDIIQLFFNTISYDRRFNSTLEYSIDGENWYETNKYSLVLGVLNYGRNTLSIRLKDNPEFTVYKKNIFISKYYYQTLLFKIVLVFLLLTSIVLLILRILKYQDSKRKTELDKLTLELKLLTSKMNPHFTFNTINSIQHYILKNDKKQAIKYLSDFALLMLKSLDFSMAERIIITEEKEFNSLYVELENKRFDTNFKLSFQVEPANILVHNKIPSMLIQPLIENIILHADYAHLDEKLINVIITLKAGYFIIRIEDFGKGFNPNIDLNTHKSYALEIIKARIKLYNGNQYREDDVLIKTTDSSTQQGTTVILKLKEWTQS